MIKIITEKIHPFFILTFIYIIFLIVIDRTGYFTNIPPEINQLKDQKLKFNGTVISTPVDKPSYREFTVKIVYSENTIYKSSGRDRAIKLIAKCYIRDTDIRYNDRIVFIGKLKELPVYRNPGTFDYGKYLLRQNIYGFVYIDEIISVEHKNPGFFNKIVLSLRKRMTESILQNLPARKASILVKMFTGDVSYMPQDLKQIFIDAGVMHALVVSGLHVVFVVGMFLFILRFIPISNRIRSLILIIPVILYCFITGANPPIVRATVMTITVIICYFLARESAIYHSFALSAMVILLFDPQSLFSASMQLSYAACLGIVYIYPKLMFNIDKFREKILQNGNNKFYSFLISVLYYLFSLFLVSFSAQLGVTPIIAYYFYKISLIALLSNIIIVPISGLILILCFGLFFSTQIFFFLVPVFKLLILIVTDIFIKLTEFFASVPNAIIRTGQPTIYFIIIYYILLIFVFKIKNIRFRLIVVFSSIFLFFSYFMVTKFVVKYPLKITFLDVGLGDCIFIRTPDDKKIFIDCGGSNAQVGDWIIEPFLWSQGITEIDKIFITTNKWTHYSGLKTLIDDFKIKEIFILSDNLDYNTELANTIKLAKSKKININSNYSNFGTDEVKFVVFHDKIKSSYVIQLIHNKFSILFTSDSSDEFLNTISDKIGKIDILQIPQHGKKLINKKIIEILSPEYLILSTDKPYKDFNLPVYSTFYNGAIIIKVKKTEYIINSFINLNNCIKISMNLSDIEDPPKK